MTRVKTTANDDVAAFLASVPDERRRSDALAMNALLAELTGEPPPAMWGTAIVGFGRRRYRSSSGAELETMAIGFSPRKAALTIYLGDGVPAHSGDLLDQLGPHTTGEGCLYLKRLDAVDPSALRELLVQAFTRARAEDLG